MSAARRTATLAGMTERSLDAARIEAERRGVATYERHIFLCIGPDCCTEAEGAAAWSR